MTKIKKTRKEVIKDTLNAFFEKEDAVEEADVYVLTIDEEDIELLATAVNEALESNEQN